MDRHILKNNKIAWISSLLKQNVLVLFLLLFLCFMSFNALADCTERKVIRLLDRGETISDIADVCDLSEDDVWEIYDDEGSDSEFDNEGFSSGTPLSQCGCWGYVRSGQRNRVELCSSGYSVAVSCNVPCNMGGDAWRTVCE